MNQPSKDETINSLFTSKYKSSLREARRILRSAEDAEDVVQTAYFAAFRHMEQFRGECSVESWLGRIVVNCSLMKLRQRRVTPQVPLDDLLPVLESQAPPPETLCYHSEIESAHTRATSSLPKDLYDVYADSVIAENAGAKVAVRLGLTVPTTKARLFRARKKLKHALQPVMRWRAA